MSPETHKTKHKPPSWAGSACPPLTTEGIKSRKPEAVIVWLSCSAALPITPACSCLGLEANLSPVAAQRFVVLAQALLLPIASSHPLEASQTNRPQTVSPLRQLGRQTTPSLTLAP